MKMLALNTLVTVLLALARAHPTKPAKHPVRQDVATYDYVVVGCGVTGLVVSNRLTENVNTSVLCIEAGNLYVGSQQGLDHY